MDILTYTRNGDGELVEREDLRAAAEWFDCHVLQMVGVVRTSGDHAEVTWPKLTGLVSNPIAEPGEF